MALAPVAAGLEGIGGRVFAFYPPVSGVLSNEWRFVHVSWRECVVVNVASRAEYRIPRALLGDVSFADRAPAIVISLHRELELRDDTLRSAPARVIQMPRPIDSSPSESPPSSRATVVSIHPGPRADIRSGQWNTRSVTAAIVLAAFALSTLIGIATQSRRVSQPAPSEKWKELTRTDDYDSVRARLGEPARERTFEGKGRSVRFLTYPSLRFTVALEGTNRFDQHFSRAFDFSGRGLGQQSAALQ